MSIPSILKRAKCCHAQLHLQKRNLRGNCSQLYMCLEFNRSIFLQQRLNFCAPKFSAQGCCRDPHFWGLSCNGLNYGWVMVRATLQWDVAHGVVVPSSPLLPLGEAGTLSKGVMLTKQSKQDGLPRTRDRLARRNLGYCLALMWSVRGGGPGTAMGQSSPQGKRESSRSLPRALEK